MDMNGSAKSLFLAWVWLTASTFGSQAAQPGNRDHIRDNKNRQQADATAVRYLEEVETGLAKLSPPMQSSLLLLESNAYRVLDKAKAAELLSRSYDIFLSLPDQDRPDIKALGAEVVSATARLSPAHIRSRLPEDPELKAIALRVLVENDLSARRLDSALALYQRIEREPEVYQAAREILSRLPASDTRRPNGVMLHAIAVFKNTQDPQVTTGSPDDLASVLVRFSSRFSDEINREAIELLLKQVQDDKSARRQKSVVGNFSGSPFVFVNPREFRLFQIWPLLRGLDEAEADRLLKESTQASEWMQRFPNGAASSEGSAKDEQKSRVSYGISRSSEEAGALLQRVELSSIESQTVAMASTDLQKALMQADRLPADSSSRTLLGMARVFLVKEPELCSKVLSHWSVLAAAKLSSKEWHDFVEAAIYYAKLGDLGKAQSVLKQASRMVEDIYHQDANPDDPNQAIKLFWPSSQHWSDIVEAAAALSPSCAEDVIAAIDDEEINASAKVTAAASLLKTPIWRGTSPMVIQRPIR
jgi:hypothetical protein